jgi:hypothetical protein
MTDPHSSHYELDEEIYAALDGEASHEDIERLNRRLEADETLARRYAECRRLKQAVANLQGRTPADADRLFRACMARIDEIARVERTDRFFGRIRYALTGAVAAVLLIAGWINWQGAGGAAHDSLVPFRAAAIGAVEVPSLTSAVNWLRRTLRRDVQPPPTKPMLRPVRAEVTYLLNCQVGRLIFLDQAGSVYTLIVSDRPLFEGGETIGNHGIRCVREGNLNIIWWTDGSSYYAFAGQCEPEVLAELVE